MIDEERSELRELRERRLVALEKGVKGLTEEMTTLRVDVSAAKATSELTLEEVRALRLGQEAYRVKREEREERAEQHQAKIEEAEAERSMAEAEAEQQKMVNRSATMKWVRETFDTKTVMLILAILASAAGLQMRFPEFSGGAGINVVEQPVVAEQPAPVDHPHPAPDDIP